MRISAESVWGFKQVYGDQGCMQRRGAGGGEHWNFFPPRLSFIKIYKTLVGTYTNIHLHHLHACTCTFPPPRKISCMQISQYFKLSTEISVEGVWDFTKVNPLKQGGKYLKNWLCINEGRELMTIICNTQIGPDVHVGNYDERKELQITAMCIVPK